ncbi:MAG: hypothetical protein U9N14_05560 [Pseudomonadota bacterium]|nr:hypothetical protein [Pseudomonadota bacterium]
MARPYSNLRQVLTVPFQANQPVRREIEISGFVRELGLQLAGTLDITGAGGTLQSQTPHALVPNVTLWLNDDPIHQGRWVDYRVRNYVFSKLPPMLAVAGVGVAAHPFHSFLRFPFLTPAGRQPVDSILYIGKDDKLEISIQWLDENALVTAGTKSLTTGLGVSPTVTVMADIETNSKMPKLLYKTASQDSEALAAGVANTDLNIQLVRATREYHHMILTAEDIVAATGRNFVATALNRVTLRQEGGGSEGRMAWLTGDMLQREFDTLAQTVDGIQTGVYPIVFQPRHDGMNTYNVPAGQLKDLRFVIDHAGFTTNGRIRANLGWHERL